MKRLLTTLLIMLSLTVLCSKEKIVIGIVHTDYHPFFCGQSTGGEVHILRTKKYGIYIDFMKNFQKKYSNQFDVYIITLPKKRLLDGMAKGSIHAYSINFASNKKGMLNSAPLYVEKELLIMLRNEQFDIRDPFDLFGKTVGVIRGFQYPLDKYFNKKKIIKDELSTMEQQIAKLKAGRVDAISVNSYPFYYNLRRLKLNKNDYVAGEYVQFEMEFCTQVIESKKNFRDILNKYILENRTYFERLITKYCR